MPNVLHGVDRATPYTLADLAQLPIQPDICFVYSGGINLAKAARAWTPNMAKALADGGKIVIPIQVGQNYCMQNGINTCTAANMTAAQGTIDGNALNAAIDNWAHGINAGIIDLEDPPPDGDFGPMNAYVTAQILATDADRMVIIYARNGFFEQYQPPSGRKVGQWLADWFNVPDESMTNFPGAHPERYAWHAWQYSGSSGYDLDVAEPLPMTTTVDTLPGTLYQLSDGTQARWFKEKGFDIAHGFRAFWESYGPKALATFGFPISSEFDLGQGTDHPLTVQYFQRARFEFHPDNNHPETWNVELGLVGDELAGYQLLAKKYSPAFEKAITPAGVQ
jgi:hypothetical protein